MKVVVLIQAHKELALLNRLIRAFDDPSFAVYVSLDLKSGIDAAKLDPRARLVEPRREIYWGEFSWVQSALDSFTQIEREQDYGYVINISGQDYPVWSSKRILRFLEAAKGKIFAHHATLGPGGWPEAADRVEHHHYSGRSLVRKLLDKAVRGARRLLGLKRAMPDGMTAYGGSNWFTLPREAVAAILVFVAANPRYMEFMRTVSIADEVVFHTILLNSPLRGSVVNDNHRYVDWSERLPNPKLLTHADHAKIVASGMMLCRKIDLKSGSELLDLLDAGRRDA
ncbi:MAG: beta-1,6-N-acetylglucosaminyltransferase [Elusimicrobiota bacterium]|nr:beta-1,6-N-acetylglucosaminyltransferase [Elusimicrobiota bacterium]